MGRSRGRSIALSPFRKLVTDLMYFSGKVPSVTADRTMQLAPLIEARSRAVIRPTWSALFARAYGMLGRDYPVLRQAYLSFPWPRLYEHPHNIASINIERETADEKIVVYCLVRAPENRSLAEIDAIIRAHRDTPLEWLGAYQRQRRMSQLPGPLRRSMMWSSLNLFGRRRSHNYGTFGLTTICAQGAGLLHLIPLLTTTIHYGMFDRDGGLSVRFSWDHRVMDGATVGRVLADLEQIFNREMAQECLAGTASRAA